MRRGRGATRQGRRSSDVASAGPPQRGIVQARSERGRGRAGERIYFGKTTGVSGWPAAVTATFLPSSLTASSGAARFLIGVPSLYGPSKRQSLKVRYLFTGNFGMLVLRSNS